MIKEIKPENLFEIKPLILRYMDHIRTPDYSEFPIDRQMKWYRKAISEGILCILGSCDDSDTANGYLVHNINDYRTAVVFANQNFAVEQPLFDTVFDSFSPNAPYLLLESGYPTPWISEELSDYAISKGYSKFDRQYMRLKQGGEIPTINVETDLQLIECTESLLEPVSELVYRCVEGTDDQELFPYVYGTYESTLKFHQQILEGNFGTHKSTYSWVLMKDNIPIGSSFMTTSEGVTGYLMHIAIDPEFRRRGLGRYLLSHSIMNLYNIEDKLESITLAVTTRNPARLLYESLGFMKENDMSTYIWKKDTL